MRRLCLLAAVLVLTGCGTGSSAADLDCDNSRSRRIDAPPNLGGDPAAVAAWYLKARGLADSDVVEDVAAEDAPTAVVRRDGRVVARVVLDEAGEKADVETCSDFAA